MSNTMNDTKTLILNMKKVKDERNLSIDNIYDLVRGEDEVSPVSRTSIARVFREDSENQIFKWENTLRPIANALLGIETIEFDDDPETKSMKAMLKLKKDIIADLKEELDKYHKSLEFALHQIELKDKRIDQLMDDNSKLTNHILDCPYRKECQK